MSVSGACRLSRPILCRLTTQSQQRSYQKRSLLPITVRSSRWSRLQYSTEAIPEPQPEGEEKVYSPKLENIVDEISNLTLLEVADLNELLKKRLNIADAPMMPMGGMAMGAVPVKAEEEEEPEPVYVKSLFTVKLTGFDQAKKVGLIKLIKATIPDTNLVQAKKFVETTPQTVKMDLPDEEAQALKTALEEAGGTVEVD